MLHIKTSKKPDLIVNNPASVILSCQRFRNKSRCQSIECKIDLLKLDDVLLKRLDNFLTSYQSFSLLISCKKLNFFTIGKITLNQTDTHRFSITDKDWDDDLTFYKSSRDLNLLIKQPQILSHILHSRTKQFRPRKLVIKSSELPWYFIKEISVSTTHLELENSVITELPKFSQFLRFFNYARMLSLPCQVIEQSRLWLNYIANWNNVQSAINIDIVVNGIDFNFDIEKLYRFFKGRTSCVIKATIILQSFTPLTNVRHAIDNHLSEKFLQVKYNHIPSYYLKLILKAGSYGKQKLIYRNSVTKQMNNIS
uniref:Uncharacterized protein n=1 Tax=Panagrolaimus sp. ES5 TaxID=591445 RepID=A0AC34GK48_9BILA